MGVGACMCVCMWWPVHEAFGCVCMKPTTINGAWTANELEWSAFVVGDFDYCYDLFCFCFKCI